MPPRPLSLSLVVLTACASPGSADSDAIDSDSDATSTSGDTDASDVAASDTDAETSDTDATTPNGTVVRLGDCDRVPNRAARCDLLEVTCGGAPPATLDLVVFEPDPSVPRKGVVMFGSGGGGTGYYGFTGREAMLSAGYVVAERRWKTESGWFDGGTEGPGQVSCRLDALLRHVKENDAADLPLCATGNSGGSAELVYALTWHHSGEVLDFALPTSGPFHRLDLACNGANDADWMAECADIQADVCPDCAANQCQASGGILALLDSSFAADTRCSSPTADDLPALEAQSPIRGPTADSLIIPVHFLVGKLDGGPFAPMVGALHRELAAVGQAVTLTFLDDVDHEMDQSELGRDAIVNELLTNCGAD
jgi:hypothetical protein